MPPRRTSWWVLEGAAFLVSLVVLNRYGWGAWFGLLLVDMASYWQGLDRGEDIARAGVR